MPTSLTHAYAQANGIRLHYVTAGEGPLVILCHGWPETWYVWRHQITALAAAGFRVVAPDQRGYGSSEAPDPVEAYDVTQLVGDMVGLANALDAGTATIIGHDWGSLVAAYCALLRPDLFTAVGMMSAPYIPRWKIRPATRYELATQQQNFYLEYFLSSGRVEREMEEDVRKTILGILYTGSADARSDESQPQKSFTVFPKGTRFVDNLMSPPTLPDWLSEADVEVITEQFTRSGFRGPTNWYRNIDRNWALTPFLDGAKIMQPAMFLAGAMDGVLKTLQEEYENLGTNVPNLRFNILIEGAGHWVQQEKPQDVNDALLLFLEGLKLG